MRRNQIHVGDELMLGNGLVDVLHKSAWTCIPDCIECRPHGSPEWTRINARPEYLSRPVKIKETKLQRDALRLARWWYGENGGPCILTPKTTRIEDEVRASVPMDGPWQDEVVASAILGEVM
jgi:hypothetical protein